MFLDRSRPIRGGATVIYMNKSGSAPAPVPYPI